MYVAITQDHNEARLQGSLNRLDTGTGNAAIRIYGGDRPATPADTPTSAMLVEIELTKPAGTVADGKLALTQAADGLIQTSGIATWARIVDGNGATTTDLDCSDMAGNGAVKLVSTQLYAGGDAKLVSAELG